MPYVNVFQTEFEYDGSDPPGFRGSAVNVGTAAGGRENIVKLFELPPGEALCPYHYEYVEEWLLVLDGAVQVRGPDGIQALPSGALACFAPGPEGAHKVSNSGEHAARVLMWSSAAVPAISVYPDSDKIGVWPGNPDDVVMLRRADGYVPYFDGESAD
jgi:uncharacterized cupin superfamily protein